MTSHISDELPRLLSGEASREDVLSSAAHLRECEDCRQDLVSAVVSHASLTSAHRFAPEMVNAIRESSEEALPSGLPDLTAVFEQVRREATQSTPHARRVPRIAIAAVAAGLVFGAGGLALVEHVGSSAPKSTSIALSAYGIGHSGAEAKLVGSDTMKITATSLPSLGSAQRYEVWLTNSSRTRMQPVGWIGTNGKAALTIPQNLMQTYSAIEVSVQPVDAPTYDFSGVSVLRGTYRT
ncbi:MAG TPA: anti-sigma factor [Jatrophihabitantaceae bacterium]|nr:anti-sigma factor [Jatrophihabitantaceae bacterium]